MYLQNVFFDRSENLMHGVDQHFTHFILYKKNCMNKQNNKNQSRISRLITFLQELIHFYIETIS